MPRKKSLISIVTPFFNEAECIPLFSKAILELIDSLPELDFEIICVDDGSQDTSLKILQNLAEQHHCFRLIELSRNFGKEAALTAGIDFSKGDAVIPIDADLQDPPSLIIPMIKAWQSGSEVVLAKRVAREKDSFFKRYTAQYFYRFNNRIASIPIPENVGDLRLMDRVVIDALKQLPERQRFMKGLFAWVGFKTQIIEYHRGERVKGGTKFSIWKLWNFAIDGITSFSTLPLRVWSYLGAGIAVLSLFYALFIVTRTLILGIDVPGYASLLVAVLFLGSLQLISIGLLGEYVGRLYLEAKQRPVYLVRKVYESAK